MVGERLGRARVRRHNRFLVTSRHLTGGSADDLGADEDFDPDLTIWSNTASFISDAAAEEKL